MSNEKLLVHVWESINLAGVEFFKGIEEDKPGTVHWEQDGSDFYLEILET